MSGVTEITIVDGPVTEITFEGQQPITVASIVGSVTELHMGGVVTTSTGAGSSSVMHEIPNGAINGSNNIFTTLNNFQPGSVNVYVEGVSQTIVDDFQTVGTSTIQLTTPPAVGEHLTVSYVKE
jgi:hypothetical protein